MNTKKIILVIDNDNLKDRILNLLSPLKYEVSIEKGYINIAEQHYNTTENVIIKSKNLYEIYNQPVIVIEESIEEVTSINNPKIERFHLICASFYSGSINTAFESRIEDASDYEILDEFISTKLKEYYSEYLLPKKTVKEIIEIAVEAFRVRKFREVLNSNQKKKKSNIIEFKKSPKRVLSKGSI